MEPKESVDKSPIEQAAKKYLFDLINGEMGDLHKTELQIINAFIAGANWSPVKGDDTDLERLVSMVCDQFDAGFAGREEFCKKTIAYWKQSLPSNQFKSASGVLNVIETNLKQKKDQWDKAVPYDEKAKLRAVIDEYEELKQKLSTKEETN